MIIDIHTHTFPEKIAARALSKLSLAAHCVPYTEATDASLLSSMERSGVDVSIICPVATSADRPACRAMSLRESPAA